MNLKISAILLTHNHKCSIEEALLSVLKQTRPPDQIIISDDSSYDETLQICSQIIKKSDLSERITITKNTVSKGPMANILHAITHCNTDWCVLFAGDDISALERIQVIEAVLDRSTVKPYLIVSNAWIINESKEVLGQLGGPSFKEEILNDRNIFKISIPIAGCTLSFSREIISNSLSLPSLLYLEDAFLHLRAKLFGPTVYIPEKLVYYRWNETNTAGSPATRKKEDVLLFQKKRLQDQVLTLNYIFSDYIRIYGTNFSLLDSYFIDVNELRLKSRCLNERLSAVAFDILFLWIFSKEGPNLMRILLVRLLNPWLYTMIRKLGFRRKKTIRLYL